MSNNDEIGSFRTKKGNRCVVTNTQVLWYHADGSIYQVFIRDIRSVTLERTGFFSTAYVVNIYKVGSDSPEGTDFASEDEQKAMAEAIQTAMRNYGRL